MPATSPAVTIDRKDSRFSTLKKGHNLRFPATEAEAASRILMCADADQVAEALQRVVSSGLRPTVRSGGHCYEDFVANNPNGAIIDISLHNRVDAEPAGRPYRIAAGAVLGVVYEDLYKRYNVTLPAGTCYTVGAGGHVSGGGYGVLSRLHGLTVDWISEVDILTVDANGKVIQHRATKSKEPELLRACRGAGNGQFGLITGFRFDQLPPAPQEIAEAGLSFSWDGLDEARFTKILVAYGDYFATRGKDPDTWGLFTGLDLSPRGSGGGPGNRGSGRIGIGAQFCNPDGTCRDLSVLHEFFSRFKDLGPVVTLPTALNSGNSSATIDQHDPAGESAHNFYQVNKEPWLDATISGSGSGGATRAKYKSAYMKESFTPAECSAIYRALTTATDAHGSVLAVDSYGGAINNADRLHDTAIAQRSSIMKLQWQSYWRDEGQDAGRMKYLDDYYTAVYTGPHVDPKHQGTPYGPGFEGCYMNYPDTDMLRYSYWPELYYGRGDLYPFLQKIKKQYDPNNVFHSSMSVRA